jgi:hypothetical protein
MEQLTPNFDVSVAPIGSEWEVAIIDKGRTAVIHFLLEEHARSFANYQMRRLGLVGPGPRRTLDGEAGIIAGNRM